MRTCLKREGSKSKAKVANRTRESRPSGMKAGAYGNMGYYSSVATEYIYIEIYSI